MSGRPDICRLTAALRALSGWRRLGAAFCLGALTALALPPVYFLPVCFITFPVLVLLLDGIFYRRQAEGAPVWRAVFLTGWSFGFGYFVAGLWWISNAMLVDPASFGWVIPFAVLGLPAVFACYYGLAALIAGVFWRDGYGRLLALALGFGVAEWLRGVLFTGFPWNAIGYTAMPVAFLMQPAAVFGLYGMNALAVLVFAGPVLLTGKGARKTGLAVTALLVVADVGFGLYRLGGAPELDGAAGGLEVRLIQPAIAQHEKNDPGTLRAGFDKQLRLTAARAESNGQRPAATPQLVIWPETAVPYPLDYNPQLAAQIGSVLQAGQFALVGTVRAEPDGARYRYFNSMQLIDHEGRIAASADKIHLVPFGEYMPFGKLLHRIGLQAIAEVAGGYSAGEKRRTITLSDNTVILPLICYEVIFPTGLDYDGAPPDALVNISNDAWFGDTPGPWQHLLQAQVRAVENGLPLLRATNNGISAIIDPYGRIITMLGHNQSGFIEAALPGKIVPIWHSGPGLIAALLVFGSLFVSVIATIFLRQR